MVNRTRSFSSAQGKRTYRLLKKVGTKAEAKTLVKREWKADWYARTTKEGSSYLVWTTRGT